MNDTEETTMLDQTQESLLPQASELWKKPNDFNMDPNDRKQSYETACAWLGAVGVDGHQFYRRVKDDIRDPDDTASDAAYITFVVDVAHAYLAELDQQGSLPCGYTSISDQANKWLTQAADVHD
ncbi:hypothetical protein AAF712_015666 [Marasmius tenuissimus]|uniref:Uncharacterized protein n=1 Tax=Marasmius tenuissimus TaxID=585030 RepID=A0ABR2Z8R3_9AGAR